MEIILYIFFIVLSLFFLVLGFALHGKGDVFKYVGFAFFFLLSIMLIPGVPGNISYESGHIDTYSYDNGTIETISRSTQYSTYESHSFGIYLALMAIFGFIQVQISRKGANYE